MLYSIYVAIVFVLTGFLLLQIPSVQKALIERYTGDLKEVIGFNVTFSSINLRWYDRMVVKNLVIEDPEHNAMIRVGDLRVNFRLASLWENKEINIDGAAVDSASVNIKTIQETDSTRDLNINVFIDRINNMSTSTGTGKSTKLNIGEIVLDRSQFIYNQADSDSIKEGFDYKHFKLALNDGELTSFKVIGDTIQFQLNSLTAVDAATKLDVKSLQTFFRISQTNMEFLGLHAKAGRSVISDTIIFSYNSQRDFSDFNNKVSFNVLLKDTYLHPADLELFAPGAKAIGQPVTLSGKLSGRVNRLHYTDMDLRVGNTILRGSVDMDGLPSINETFIRLKVDRSRVDIDDLHFAFDDFVYERLKPLGDLNILGTFTGFTNDFVADATLDGRLGWIRSNVNLKVNEKNVDKTLYKGGIELRDFRMGRYFNDTTRFQDVTLHGNIAGRGLTYESADFTLVGTVNSVGIMGYDYVNINTNARFAKQFFSGSIKIDDPNLRFNAEGSIDFRSDRDIVQIQANLDTALVHKLGFSKKDLAISSYVDINSHGLQVDSLFGDALFKNTKIHYNQKFIELDSMHLISEQKDLERHITFRSSLFDASMKGNYYYSTLFSDFTRLFQELMLSIRNDKNAIAAYYNSKRKSTQEYQANIEIDLHDINPLMTLAGIDLKLNHGPKIEGRFTNGQTSILQAFTNIDTITYQGKTFIGNDIEFTGSKIRDSANVLAMATIQSKRQLLSKALTTNNLLLEGIWNRDHVDLGLDVDQEGFSNKVRLRTEVDFLYDSTMIKVLPSRILALDREWVVDQKNYILFRGKEFTVRNLRIHNDQQSILIDGLISEDPGKELTMTVSNLNLDIINTFSTEKFMGTLNATLVGKDLHHRPFIQNDIDVVALTVNDFLIGDVDGKNEWNPEKQKFDISFSIDRLHERTLVLTGIYDPEAKTDPLDVKAELNNTRLKMLEPVLRGLFSEIDGELTGVYQIRGTFFSPALSGKGKVKDGKLKVDYLSTLYSFNGELGMSPDKIIFDNIEMIDAYQNKGTLHGYVAHKNFNKFVIDLDGDFVNFQVLNTTSKDNDLFYGQGYATGSMNIFGPSSNLKISANARTEKNTKIYIPISGTSEVDKKDFITFAHFTDSLSISGGQKKKAIKKTLTGVTVDINLDITPAAYAEIIFDIKAGDIIRGRGNGDLRLQLDTKGEFNMFGGIRFTEGAYNFTLYNIINKEFNIKPGSQLLWYGDPYAGIMNITAGYRQLASLAPIYDKDLDAQTDPAIKRKYPIEVQLKLDGPMLSPQFVFDLVATDLPSTVSLTNGTSRRLSFDFAAFKTRLDEQELKRQVFSLIILRKLSPLDAFSTSGSLANSVSELLSNQLSYWLTQMDQNLEIDLDLGALDTEAFNTFQLRLSYSFLNGRLRVTRNGSIYSQNPAQQQSVAAMAGDWTVDYLLTPDGKFRVKMYSRSTFNAISSSLGAQTAVTTGFSLMHTQSFNEVRDLLRGARDRRRKELELEREVNDLDSLAELVPVPKSGGNN
ncbi:MAG: translocation/assembly module TamB domain-containing protein [Bacteroidota bacterium]